jgi:hypothetical protein
MADKPVILPAVSDTEVFAESGDVWIRQTDHLGDVSSVIVPTAYLPALIAALVKLQASPDA